MRRRFRAAGGRCARTALLALALLGGHVAAAAGAELTPPPPPDVETTPSGDTWRGSLTFTKSVVGAGNGATWEQHTSGRFVTTGRARDPVPGFWLAPAEGGSVTRGLELAPGDGCVQRTDIDGSGWVAGPGVDRPSITIPVIWVQDGMVTVDGPLQASFHESLTSTYSGCTTGVSTSSPWPFAGLVLERRLTGPLDAGGNFTAQWTEDGITGTIAARLVVAGGRDVFSGTGSVVDVSGGDHTTAVSGSFWFSCPVGRCVTRANNGTPACRDGRDNDHDGLIDLLDTGCSGRADRSELGPQVCDDGKDNDGDGLADFAGLDRGCSRPSDDDERAVLTVRVDGPGSVDAGALGVCDTTCRYPEGTAALLTARPLEPNGGFVGFRGCPAADGLGCTATAGPADVTVKAVFDPVVTYSPKVFFTRDERHWPMDPDDFVLNSSLWWANDDRDGCRKRDVRKVSTGKVDPRRLASGRGAKYRHTYCYKGVLATRTLERRFSTADLTSPAETGKPPRHANGRWGFFLNLNDAWHRGIPPFVDEPGAGYPNAPTMVVEFKPGRYVVYWFFFGRNYVRVLGFDDVHEGDWERMAVRLDERNRATHVAYWQHYCQPSAKHGSLLTWGQMEQRGHLAASVHPHAYLARGAHASYPDAGGVDGHSWLPCMNVMKGAADHHAGGSVIWETWQHGRDGFADVTGKPWYGFGGGWGSKTAQGDNAFWGPLGPGPKKPPVPASWR